MMDKTVKYILLLISTVLAITGIPFAHANIPFMSPMGLGFYILPIILTAVFAMIIEVIIILILLRKKSLNIIGLAILLFIANIASFILFLILLPSLFEEPPDFLIVISETLVILFETFVLTSATRLTIFRKPEGLPLTIKGAFLPVLIGNFVSITLGLFLMLPTSPHTFPAVGISDQGTWETTLEARDFDNNISTIEGYYDKALGITWLADAHYSREKMEWSDAKDWANSLDINGIRGWRLPTLLPVSGNKFNKEFSNSALTDAGSAYTTTDGTDGGWRNATGEAVSEMGHMYYVTLGNLGKYVPDSSNHTAEVAQAGGELTNTGPFSNILVGPYWFDKEDENEDGYDSIDAWIFLMDGGLQLPMYKLGVINSWPVHDGDVGTPISKSSGSTE